MCNKLRNGKRIYKINDEGIGYKIFVKGNEKRKTLTLPFKWHTVPKGKWLKWNPKHPK